MKISEYIAALEAIKKEHGDIRCTRQRNSVVSANGPEARDIMQKSPRESITRYWDSFYKEREKIEKVCDIK